MNSKIAFGSAMLVLVAGLLGVAGPAFATEALDLGKIPRDVVEGWCGAHSGHFLDWGGGLLTCMTDAGGAMVCNNEGCKGFPPKTVRQQSGRPWFPPAGTGGVLKPPAATR